MPHTIEKEIGDRTDWILRLLYAPARGEPGKPIIGKTRMMKGCFLLHRTLDREFEISSDFEFRPDDYGPLDPLVYDALELLEGEGLVCAQESERYTGTEYSLTEQGMEKGREEFKELDSEVQQHIIWLKQKHVLNPLSKLLSFVYNQYPNMAKNSELV